ncbi:MAG: glycoside hydrolase family 3 protein, partial [Melioribacteraceae bacterium]
FVVILFLPSSFSYTLENEKNSFASIFKMDASDSAWVENEFLKLSQREKCAQMIFANVWSRGIDTASKYYREVLELVTKQKVGGIIYSIGKIQEQVKLTNTLQSLSQIPLMISADYERGLGMRLSDAVEFPYNMAFAAAGDTRLSYYAGKATAIEARAIGVHQNYAPIVDVNHDYRNPIINVRSYSEDPLEIAYHSAAYIRGLHEGNMISSVKHFPGHGATDLDSHKGLPVINSTKEEFEKSDLVPFRLAVKSGVKSVMIGHLQVPAYEDKEGMPATFSEKIVNGLLRKKLGFDGLVVTDAMNMLAVVDNFSTYEAMKMAVNAGNDIIIYPPNVEEAINALDSAVTN